MKDTRHMIVTETEAKRYLRSQGYMAVNILPDGRWVCVAPRNFHADILSGTLVGVRTGWDDQWSYTNIVKAVTALLTWCDQALTADLVDEQIPSEPTGWHRHVPSNRRRDEEGNEWIEL